MAQVFMVLYWQSKMNCYQSQVLRANSCFFLRHSRLLYLVESYQIALNYVNHRQARAPADCIVQVKRQPKMSLELLTLFCRHGSSYFLLCHYLH